MARPKDPTGLNRDAGTYITEDQFAFPKKQHGAPPDGDHLSATEWLFMVLLGRWNWRGLPCMLGNIDLAEAMGMEGTRESLNNRIKVLLNGRWVRGARWPGLCDPTRGFIVRQYGAGGRHARQLFTTDKWKNFQRPKYRVVGQPEAATTSVNCPSGNTTAPEDTPTPRLADVIVEAATIAETHISPPELGQAVAEKIRAGAGRFHRPGDLPGVVWMAADRGKGFGWIVRCDQNGINPVEANEAIQRVLGRAEDGARAAAQAAEEEKARQEAARRRAEPPPPATPEDIREWVEWAATPGHPFRQLGRSKLKEAGINPP